MINKKELSRDGLSAPMYQLWEADISIDLSSVSDFYLIRKVFHRAEATVLLRSGRLACESR